MGARPRAPVMAVPAVAIVALLSLAAPGLGAAAPPNIILVFIDDLGWGDFSSFGNPEVTTEHVDRLAAEGLRFEQFYVNSPICSPSRTGTSASTSRPCQTSCLAARGRHETGRSSSAVPRTNLSPSHPDVVRRLTRAVQAWHAALPPDTGQTYRPPSPKQ